MTISRRTLVRGLSAGALGTGMLGVGALSGCTRPGRRPKQTEGPSAAALVEPETPLVIGQIGAAYGRMGAAERAISLAIDEARIEINARWDGLFGKDITLLERHLVQEPGEDLDGFVAELVDKGATCLISSVDEDSLVAMMPAIVDAGIAVIDVLSTGMSVRDPEVSTANLLTRLCPDERIIAQRYAEEALGSSSEDAGPPGTIAVVSEDTAQGRSLVHELEQILNPRGGTVHAPQLYPPGKIGDVGAMVKAVLKDLPALVVVNGGPETASFVSALYKAGLDDDGRPERRLPVRLSPAATLDHVALGTTEGLVPGCYDSASGYRPGGEVTVDHENMMLNRSAEFLRTGYGYSQQAYDAVVIACLAAQHALSVEGSALAAAFPAVLTGQDACPDYDSCRGIMRTALDQESRATITYEGHSGELVLGPQGDVSRGGLREYTWTEDLALKEPSASSFEAEG